MAAPAAGAGADAPPSKFTILDAATEATHAGVRAHNALRKSLPSYVPEVEVTPRFHHIRFNDYERYEPWNKAKAEASAFSVQELLASVFEDLGVSPAYDNMDEFASDILAHVQVIRRLREIRGLPVPASLSEGEALLQKTKEAWAEANDGFELAHGEPLRESVDLALKAQEVVRGALFDMCPSLQGDAVAGVGPDLQWSRASLADLDRPGPLPEDASEDPILSTYGVDVSSVANWRLSLSNAYAGLEQGCAAAVVLRERPRTSSAARDFDEHIAGVAGHRSRAAAGMGAINAGDVASYGEADGLVAGPAAGSTLLAQDGDLYADYDQGVRGDAWSRKQQMEIANELSLAAQPWQTRKVAGRLSDGAPSHLRRAAEGLEKSGALTAGQRARILQETANRLDEAQELTQRELAPGDLARMSDEWAKPSRKVIEKPWEMRFPVNTKSPDTGRAASDDMFRDGERPLERDEKLPDGAEYDAVHGAANPSSADVAAQGRAGSTAAAMTAYHAFVSKISKRA
ncbi:hypothetical protein FNF27_05411 [Cafeteria roenbergensis]|uniref:Uncharacterized protein n=1 Tax=Cafeteria roenbergensis TaxID=33653 RepID=A0A5A8DL05_CAFRO|nr:hypothetical protein FNF28_03244 [Cafeteria roenbergensis]KAA0167157.1 hypothetical protein FNF31_01043 [Cafeteria roenbergensis]KAA0173062.1 hypothetical protein FNF27_05411 [Cafeteria roenbergensis]